MVTKQEVVKIERNSCNKETRLCDSETGKAEIFHWPVVCGII